MGQNERNFCMELGAVAAERGTRAALLKETRWENGEDIVIRFTGGDSSLRARIRQVAEEWTGPTMANLMFHFVDRGPADIRIAFVQGNASWSYLGTVCRQIDPAEPTMNFGWLTPTSSDDELRRVVLHEFGHALGLFHEHQNPLHPIAWNRGAVIADLSGPPNHANPATIENNVFRRYDADAVQATDTDRQSIMMHPIPRSWTTDGFSVRFNHGLSDKDRELIREAYPG